jgi:hypothetical protein
MQDDGKRDRSGNIKTPEQSKAAKMMELTIANQSHRMQTPLFSFCSNYFFKARKCKLIV